MDNAEIAVRTEPKTTRNDGPPRPPAKIEIGEIEPIPQRGILVPIEALNSLSPDAKKRAVTRALLDTRTNMMIIIGRTEAASEGSITSTLNDLNEKGENCRGFVDISTFQDISSKTWVPERTMSRYQGALIIEEGTLSYLNMGQLKPMVYRDGRLSDDYRLKIIPAINKNEPFAIKNGDTIGFESSSAGPVTFCQDHEDPDKWFFEYANPRSKQPSERTKLLIELTDATAYLQENCINVAQGHHIDMDPNTAIENRIKEIKKELANIKPEGVEGAIK